MLKLSFLSWLTSYQNKRLINQKIAKKRKEKNKQIWKLIISYLRIWLLLGLTSKLVLNDWTLKWLGTPIPLSVWSCCYNQNKHSIQKFSTNAKMSAIFTPYDILSLSHYKNVLTSKVFLIISHKLSKMPIFFPPIYVNIISARGPIIKTFWNHQNFAK